MERAPAALDAFIRKKMELGGIPALAIGVTDKEATIGCWYYGYSNTDARIPPDAKTLFEIGSISKSFASVVALQLVEEGLLDVHRPVEEYLPWLEADWGGAGVTMHHLMSHTAGLPIGGEATTEPISEIWALGRLNLECRPGEFYHYSNIGYKVVGLVIEKLTGQSCAEAIRQRVLEPLGMSRSHASITHALRKSLAVPYEPSPDDRPIRRGTQMAPAPFVASDSADGSISSTPEDMAAYARMLLNSGAHPGGRILSNDSFRTLTKPVIRPTNSPVSEFYSYGLSIERYDDLTVIGHTGGMVGYMSAMMVDLDRGIGAIVLANGATDVDDVASCGLRAFGSNLPSSWERPREIPYSMSTAEAAEYVGTYSSDQELLEVFIDGRGRLFMASNGRSAMLEPRGKDAFLVDLPGFEVFRIRFGREQGFVTEILYGSRVLVRGGAGKARIADNKDHETYIGHYRSSNLWLTNFRILTRKGVLLMVEPSGEERELVRLDKGLFRIGVDKRIPERIRFEGIVDGRAHRADISGQVYARMRDS